MLAAPGFAGRCAFAWGPYAQACPRAHTATGLPLSGTITLVAWPPIAATNLSAVASMIGNDP